MKLRTLLAFGPLFHFLLMLVTPAHAGQIHFNEALQGAQEYGVNTFIIGEAHGQNTNIDLNLQVLDALGGDGQKLRFFRENNFNHAAYEAKMRLYMRLHNQKAANPAQLAEFAEHLTRAMFNFDEVAAERYAEQNDAFGALIRSQSLEVSLMNFMDEKKDYLKPAYNGSETTVINLGMAHALGKVVRKNTFAFPWSAAEPLPPDVYPSPPYTFATQARLYDVYEKALASGDALYIEHASATSVYGPAGSVRFITQRRTYYAKRPFFEFATTLTADPKSPRAIHNAVWVMAPCSLLPVFRSVVIASQGAAEFRWNSCPQLPSRRNKEEL